MPQEQSTTIITDATVNLGEIESPAELLDALIEQYPEYAELLADMDPDDYASVQGLLDAINDAIELDTEEEGSPITISQDTATGELYFEQLRDIAFSASGSLRLTISVNGEEVLDNIYQPGFDGMVHLDLQDLVRAKSGIFLPSAIQGHESIIDGICHETSARITLSIHATEGLTETTYNLTVNAFESAAAEKMSDIDSMSIPPDYLMPISLHLPVNMQDQTVSCFLIDNKRKLLCNSGVIPSKDNQDEPYESAVLFAKDIPAQSIPFRTGVPFSLLFSTRYPHHYLRRGSSVVTVWATQDVSTPVFKVVPGRYQQYLFLNKYGHYDNIAMSGALTFTPEYDIENANRTYTVERVRSTKNNLWTQATGPLSKATMEVLSELLLSPIIYRYVPGESLKRIVIESPTLSISSHKSINTATFSWRYVEK